MSRPTVLVATTNPAMAYALQVSLKEKCKSLGLKLEVCPDGVESDIGKDVRIYDSAEALFDALEKRDPMELADTLVVLDVGVYLVNAFHPAATKDKEGWHVTDNRAGVAVELLLRFPQVFSVFLSPAVPWDENKLEGLQWPKPAINCAIGNWEQFHYLRKLLGTRHMLKKLSNPVPIDCLDQIFALQVPLHFVSPLDQGAGLESTLKRFARGMRCWFDPTGLRTLVRNYFLGTLFGSDEDWSNTWEENSDKKLRREVLLDRLDHVAIAVDEEREFAMLNAYTAYKFGRRAWIVTTFAEFDKKPLWVFQGEEGGKLNVVVLRDIDLRFPDIPDNAPAQRDLGSVRGQLKSVGSQIWSKYISKQSNDAGSDRLGASWRVRAVSCNAGLENNVDWFDRLGQNHKNVDWSINFGQDNKKLLQEEMELKFARDSGKDVTKAEEALEIAFAKELIYSGCRKPIVTLYDLVVPLEKDWISSVAARISPIDDTASSRGHGAPYLNLAMAESLLLQTRRCGKSSIDNLIGALMAGEAQELLLGMSRTTALEALLLQHKHEVMAEVEFPGVSHAIDIKYRQEDVDAILQQYTNGGNCSLPMKNMFLSQFWDELKQAYRNGEQFAAAEVSNARSLVHNKWMPMRLPSMLESCNAMDYLSICVKSGIMKIATSFLWWSVASVIWIFLASLVFYPLALCSSTIFADAKGWSLLLDVVLTSITLQPMGLVDDIVDQCGAGGTVAAIFHLVPAYVLFGLLISMIFRKITRS